MKFITYAIRHLIALLLVFTALMGLADPVRNSVWVASGQGRSELVYPKPIGSTQSTFWGSLHTITTDLWPFDLCLVGGGEAPN